LDESAGQICGRTRAGSLYCWGHVGVPGRPRPDPVTASQPMRIEGLPALDGFAMVRNAIVGWDEHGEAYSLSDDHGREMTVQRGVVIVSVRPDGLETVETKVVRVRDASYRCLITPRGQLLCNGPTSSGTRY